VANLSVDVDYQKARAALKQYDDAIRKELDKELRGIAREVVNVAKANAAWSTTIPPAYGVTVVRKGAGVKIRRSKSVIAVLNEFGPWRHPLYGNFDYWYEQPARPSVKPAVESERPKLVAKANAAAERARKKAGL
jgi:hypothetical protein